MRAADARRQRRSALGQISQVGALVALGLSPFVFRKRTGARVAMVALGGSLAVVGNRATTAADHEAAIAVAMSQCVSLENNQQAISVARAAYRWWLDTDLDKADLVRAMGETIAPPPPTPPWAEQPAQPPEDVRPDILEATYRP